MAEHLIISSGGKEEKYGTLYSQIKSLTEGESDIIANMANISAMIHATFGFWWTGFYRVCRDSGDRNGILVLGPFQGPLACSSASRSEIVVPVVHDNEIIGVLDIDSAELDTFDETDKLWLEKIASVL